MIYLPFLEIVTLLIAFLIKLIILYFLIRLLDKKIKFPKILKPILLYELVVFLFYLLKPDSFLRGNILLVIFPPIIFVLVFGFLMNKFSSLNWKRAIIVFAIMFFVLTPIISFSRTMVIAQISELSIFEAERLALREKMLKNISHLFFPSAPPITPLSMRITSSIANGVLEEGYTSDLRGYMVARLQ